jgi:phosphatidyl-myo-inositol dimannoside synthase
VSVAAAAISGPRRRASARTAAALRVVSLAPDLFDGVGGIQTFQRAMAMALDELAAGRGWTVDTVVLNDRGGSGLERRYLGRSAGEYLPCGGSRARFAATALRRAARADVVLFGHVNFAPLALAMPRPVRHLAVYGVDVWRRLRPLERAGVARMRTLLTISRYTQDQMLSFNDGDPARFTWFPVSLDPLHAPAPHPPTRGELGLPEGPLVLTVARLAGDERYKGVDTVIEALPAVLARVPDAHYVVVGTGSDLPRLRALAVERGVADRVTFAGRVADGDLAHYYAHCDVFALPSWKEGFGIVFLEAMQSAQPCVAAAAGAAPEVVDDGVTGLLVPPAEPGPLADALVRLLADEPLRRRMGAAGKARLQREFSYARLRERMEALLCP